MRLGRLRGIAVAASAGALPSELEQRAAEPAPSSSSEYARVPGRLDAAGVYAELFGPAWAETLRARGFELERPEREWGVRTREWSAAPLDLQRGLRPRLDAGDLAEAAGRRALERAGLAASDVALVVAATSTPPRITSSLAARTATALGIQGAAFDVRAGGAGGLDAWITAASLIAAGARNALVVAADVPSHYLDPRDVAGATLYGDGGAALVLSRSDDDEAGLLAATARTRRLPGRAFTVPGALPPNPHDVAAYVFARPDGTYLAGLAELWSAAARALGALATEVGRAPLAFLPYAVTRGGVERAALDFGAAPEHTHHLLAEQGCQGAAGVLATLAARLEDRTLLAGSDLAALAVAGGATSCGLVWRLARG